MAAEPENPDYEFNLAVSLDHLHKDRLALEHYQRALGIGLAAPWLLVAARPSLVGFLPRPGPWMPWLKRGLALLLAGTMLWLGTVLASVMATGRVNDADTQWTA